MLHDRNRDVSGAGGACCEHPPSKPPANQGHDGCDSAWLSLCCSSGVGQFSPAQALLLFPARFCSPLGLWLLRNVPVRAVGPRHSRMVLSTPASHPALTQEPGKSPLDAGEEVTAVLRSQLCVLGGCSFQDASIDKELPHPLTAKNRLNSKRI